MVHKYIGAALISLVDGHGHISNPMPRGIGGSWSNPPVDPYKTEPQSMGAIGAPSFIPVCGRENAGTQVRRDHDPVTELTLDSDYTFEAKITAHHMGHMTVRICPFVNNDFTPDDLSSCYVVKGTEYLGTDHEKLAPFWFLTPNTGIKTWTGRLPTLDQLPESPTGIYTLQWRWNTANSCSIHKPVYKCAMSQFSLFGTETCHGECLPTNANCPAGDNLNLYSGNCQETTCCSEVFTNCADVKFAGIPSDIAATTDGGSGASPEPEPEPASGGSGSGAPASGGSGSGEGGCQHNTDCDASLWCTNAQYTDWCPLHGSEGECPTPQCVWGGASSGGASPEPEPEPASGGSGSGAPAPVPHLISVGAGIDGTGLSVSSVEAFCLANKDALCAESTLTVTAGSLPLCTCAPDNSVQPEPEPEPRPRPRPRPVPASNPAPAPSGSGPFDCNECKGKCSTACGYANKRNQCWGSPRYIECTCADDSVHTFEGCACEHGDCAASLVQMNETSSGHAATKFSGRIQRVVSAAGEIQAEVTQHEH